ncbi:MAG: DUF354 domain-containing protein [Betaproteobacteria bacterium]|nr:DUF354 domain-containing protein [Betaproteobacteria bacterium]
MSAQIELPRRVYGEFVTRMHVLDKLHQVGLNKLELRLADNFARSIRVDVE